MVVCLVKHSQEFVLYCSQQTKNHSGVTGSKPGQVRFRGFGANTLLINDQHN